MEEEQKIADAEALAAKQKESEDNKDESQNGEGDSKDLEQKNKELYARTKKAEEEAKKLREDMKKLLGEKETKDDGTKDAKEPVKEQPINPLDVVKLVSALKDYSEEEVEYIQLISGAKKISLQDAIKSDEVQTYVTAKRAKEKAENSSQVPGGKFKGDPKKDPMFEKFSQGLPARFDFTKGK